MSEQVKRKRGRPKKIRPAVEVPEIVSVQNVKVSEQANVQNVEVPEAVNVQNAHVPEAVNKQNAEVSEAVNKQNAEVSEAVNKQNAEVPNDTNVKRLFCDEYMAKKDPITSSNNLITIMKRLISDSNKALEKLNSDYEAAKQSVEIKKAQLDASLLANQRGSLIEMKSSAAHKNNENTGNAANESKGNKSSAGTTNAANKSSTSKKKRRKRRIF